MRYGVYVFPPSPRFEPDDVVTLAQAAERSGYSSVWLGDHVAWPPEFDPDNHEQVGGPPLPAGVVAMDVIEPLTMISYLAARTERVRLGLGVLVAPYRQPLLAAKMLAMIDQLSAGRLDVGVGAGWLREEFALLDSPPFEHRGAVTDEYIQAFVSLWSDARPEFEGAFTHISSVLLNPKPVQRPHPPIWIGGNGRAAVRRAATLGDGWMPLHQSPQDLRRAISDLREVAAGRGRRVPVSAGCRFRLADEPGGDDTLIGPSDLLVERLRRFAEVGVEEVHLLNGGYGSVAELTAAWERFASEVAPKV